jgi:glucose/arabinose dehydrogenase
MKRVVILNIFLFNVILSQSQNLPAGFSRSLVAGNISNPTVMTFAPDGRIFVAEQGGNLRIIKNGTLLTNPFLQVTVDPDGERGLIGIALDPDFATNNYFYVYYTVPAASGQPPKNRIARYTAGDESVVANSYSLVLDLDNLSGATNHNGGALAFGPDGKLYVAVGDNATGSNAQNLNTYHGKMLRINKDGTAPADNPFPTGSEQRKRVWSYGLRNPYTFSIQPGTGRIFVNDVGQNTREEINDATAPGKNFGWPATEGATTNPAYTSPIYDYAHGSGDGVGCAITGGTFFNPTFTTYPASYVGKYFFMDYCNNWINVLDIMGSAATRTAFGTAIGGSSVNLTTGPDGNLYYLSRSARALYKIVSTNSSAPVITSQPVSTSVTVGQSATFSVQVSGTSPFTYQWQKNGTNIAIANQSSYTITNAQLADAGNYRVIITNIAGTVTSNAASLTVNVVPNTAPTATITAPMEGTTYVAGVPFSFSGSATDAEQGTLPSSAFSWEINFHHDDHKHDQPAITNVVSGSFTPPNQGETSANVWYRIILTVTDAQGLTGKDSVDVYPKKSLITLATDPPGLEVTLDGQPQTSPHQVESVEGILREIGVTSPQEVDGITYEFSEWQQGGGQTQMITTPEADATYTAVFTVVLSADKPEGVSGIYPLPASEKIVIHSGKEWDWVGLTDMAGKKFFVSMIKIDEQKSTIDVSSLPSGMYVLRMKKGDAVVMRKILVQR